MSRKQQISELFTSNREAINFEMPTKGIAIILVALILLSTVGPFGFTMAFGAVLAIAFDADGVRRHRLLSLSIFGVAGALATLLGNGIGTSVWGSTAVVFSVTLICGLALAFGSQAGKMAFFINIWMIISLSLSTIIYEPVKLALGFFVGSMAVAALVLVSKNETEITKPATAVWNFSALRAHLNRKSPILHFALSRSVVAAFAMWLGWQLNLAHPFWIAMTILIVVVPDRQQAARTSWQRAIGTVIGVALGAVLLGLNMAPITLLLLWLLVTLIMLAVMNVNYVLYASVLTLNLILLYQLLEVDVLFTGMERLLTTLIGIVFALATIALLGYLAARFSQN